MSPSVAPGAYLKVSLSLGFPLFRLGFLNFFFFLHFHWRYFRQNTNTHI